MTKKMLLAAVGDYRGYAEPLVAAVPEVLRWKELLMSSKYGFKLLGDKPLMDATATRQNILDSLDVLLAGAQPDDELLFLIICHGTEMDGKDQALIAYPVDGKDLRRAAITYEDVAERLSKYKPPATTDILLIAESCYAEGFGPASGKVSLYIEPTPELNLMTADAFAERKSSSAGERRGRVVRKFSDLASWATIDAFGRDESIDPAAVAEPVFLAAAKGDQAAYQEKDGYEERMAFSQEAIDALYNTRHTFNALINVINPIIAVKGTPVQEATVYGSEERRNEQFPGVAEIQGPSRGINSSAPSIRMRFVGMGCFIPPKSGGLIFGNRIVCPYDNFVPDDHEDHHFSFIEIPEDDIILPVTGSMPYRRYLRGPLWYGRFQLTEHRVLLANAAKPEAFKRDGDFDYRVPDMRVVCPELQTPSNTCYVTYPLPELFSAFFDVAGSVVRESLQQGITTFSLKYGGDKTWTGKTPRSVLLDLPFTGNEAILLITDSSGQSTAQIWIKPGSTILAGNAREKDITGDGSGVTLPEHFGIFYNLVSPAPRNPAYPTVTGVPVDACSVVRFP